MICEVCLHNILLINACCQITAEQQLEELMDKLLVLQQSLLLANPETEHVATSTSPSLEPHKEQQQSDSLAELHHSLRGYCNDVITKWQDRTQLASGRVSGNKDFIKTNQSIVTQIDHVSVVNSMYSTTFPVLHSQYYIPSTTFPVLHPLSS